MTAAELTRLGRALELLQQGRTEDCREQLVILVREAGGTPPEPPPDHASRASERKAAA